jgi:Tfp pilus assembly pilus retraction ATPase PilT
MIRVHGDIKKLNVPELSHEQVKELVYAIMADLHRKTFEERLELIFHLNFQIGHILTVEDPIEFLHTPQMYSTMQTAAREGMKTLDSTLDGLVKAGTIEKDEAQAHANDRNKFE